MGKRADLALWDPAFFGVKPALVLLGGMIAAAPMGDPNASIPTPQPVHYRMMFGAYGKARTNSSVTFVSEAAVANGLKGKLGVAKDLEAVKHTRSITKHSMIHNHATPKVEVDPETYEVRVDGVLATCEPATVLPMAQRTGRIVAYFNGQHHSLEQILDGLAASNRDVLLHISGPPEWAETRIAGSRIVLSPEPLVFPNDLMRADLLAHAGGANLVEEALSLGLPQLMIPMHIDQHVLALMLRRYGLTEMLGAGFSRNEFRNAIEAVSAPDARARVEAEAQRIKREKPDGALPALLAAATRLVS